MQAANGLDHQASHGLQARLSFANTTNRNGQQGGANKVPIDEILKDQACGTLL